jgi:hypothetical protein
MLYDPKWEKQTETKADPFSLASLIAWLEKQNPATRYCYVSNGECLLAQYFTARGYKNVTVGVGWFRELHMPHTEHAIPTEFTQVARAGKGGTTFGAALKRARKLEGVS